MIFASERGKSWKRKYNPRKKAFPRSLWMSRKHSISIERSFADRFHFIRTTEAESTRNRCIHIFTCHNLILISKRFSFSSSIGIGYWKGGNIEWKVTMSIICWKKGIFLMLRLFLNHPWIITWCSEVEQKPKEIRACGWYYARININWLSKKWKKNLKIHLNIPLGIEIETGMPWIAACEPIITVSYGEWMGTGGFDE